ncbi:hypothetical protein [Mycobacterium sp. SMC-11]|uniref:hypothetical protein n=1 Tax=Mycobacterium sp. SMC-11 TaxID=3385969 RepID=UPI00390CAF27
MSGRSGRSNGRRAQRIVGAGSAVGTFPAFALTRLDLEPTAQADVIDKFFGDLNARGCTGSVTFDTLGGSTEALLGAIRGMRQTAVVGRDCFAVDADPSMLYQADESLPAWRVTPDQIAEPGNAAWLDPINDFATLLRERDLIGNGLDGLADGRGELMGLTGSVGQQDLGGVGGNGGAGGEGTTGTTGADAGPAVALA